MTKLAIDDQLIEEARQIGQHRSKKAAVVEALKEYIERRRQFQIVNLFGTIEYRPDYDYKEQRKQP